MSPILKENVLKAAIRRRELELEMLKMKAEMKGDKIINLVKEDWLKAIGYENLCVDALRMSLKDINHKPVHLHRGKERPSTFGGENEALSKHSDTV